MAKTTSYRQLDPDEIVATTKRLTARIRERFEGRGLVDVADDLNDLAAFASRQSVRVARPNLILRAFGLLAILVVIGGIGALLLGAVGGALDAALGGDVQPLLEAIGVEGVDALLSVVIVAGAVAYYFSSLDDRITRNRVLKDLHQLRSIAHVIDMHQLTKDPTILLGGAHAPTASSPDRDFTNFQLVRYLDYCAEMLAITGKIAALYAEHLRDPVIVATVNDIETLTTNLARKIWQKIMIIDRLDIDGDTAQGARA